MRRTALFIGLVAFVLGCDESADQNTFVVNVSDINNGSSLQADVCTGTPPACVIPTEFVPVEFTNRLVSPNVVDPGTAWYDFRLRAYTVRFRRIDGGPTSGAGWDLNNFAHQGATSVIVPANGSAQITLEVVTGQMKLSTPFVELQTGGIINLIADIDFIGSSAIDPNDEIHVPVSLSVSVANFTE